MERATRAPIFDALPTAANPQSDDFAYHDTTAPVIVKKDEMHAKSSFWNVEDVSENEDVTPPSD